jgi:hypothetical protein
MSDSCLDNAQHRLLLLEVTGMNFLVAQIEAIKHRTDANDIRISHTLRQHKDSKRKAVQQSKAVKKLWSKGQPLSHMPHRMGRNHTSSGMRCT